MATFGKRVQPKHRASPGDRKREATSAARPGAHAASVSEPVAPPAPDPVQVDSLQVDPLQVGPARVEPAPIENRPVEPPHAGPPTPPPPVSPALEAPETEALPAAPVPASEPEPDPVDAGPLRVLIVDDNEDVRGLLRLALARAGVDVVGAAGDSHEALAMAQQDRPGIILLDVNLPQVAGLDLLPHLREHCPRARVVMFSAQCSDQVTETAMERGAVGFVEKGVSMKNVIEHLHLVARAPEAEVVQPFPLKAYA